MDRDVTTHGGQSEPSLWRGALSGAIAGAAGGFVMEQFQTKVMPRVQSAVEEAQKRVADVGGQQAREQGVADVGARGSAPSSALAHPREKVIEGETGPRQAVGVQRVPQAEAESGSAGATESGETKSNGEQDASEPATVTAAEVVAKPLMGRELKDEEKALASEASHYWMSMTSGAIYGVAAEYQPRATAGYGTAFGTALWAIADETIVPPLVKGEKPWSGELSVHAYALASHLVYGVTTEFVRRQVRPQLDRF